jgi:hypothetical protein
MNINLSKDLMVRALDLGNKVVSLWKNADSLDLIISANNEIETLKKLPINQSKPLLNALELCQSEITYLLSKYSQLTVIKKLIPNYRKVFCEILNIEYPKKPDKNFYRKLPLCLISDTTLTVELNNIYKDKVNTMVKSENIVLISVDFKNEIIDTAINLIRLKGVNNNKLIAAKALGLSLLSGRRLYSEICLSAIFRPNNNENCLDFLGIAKGDKEKEKEVFTIPILNINPIEFVKIHNEIISYITAKNWLTPSIIESNLHNYIDMIFSKMIVPIFDKHGVKCDISPKDFRKLYFTFAYDNAKQDNKAFDFYEFVSPIAGHTFKRLVNGLEKTNNDITTTRSYRKYEVIR